MMSVGGGKSLFEDRWGEKRFHIPLCAVLCCRSYELRLDAKAWVYHTTSRERHRGITTRRAGSHHDAMSRVDNCAGTDAVCCSGCSRERMARRDSRQWEGSIKGDEERRRDAGTGKGEDKIQTASMIERECRGALEFGA